MPGPEGAPIGPVTSVRLIRPGRGILLLLHSSGKGVRHQKPERPCGCFALLVSDTFSRTQ